MKGDREKRPVKDKGWESENEQEKGRRKRNGKTN